MKRPRWLPKSKDEQLDEEIRSHLEMAVRERQHSGMSRQEAEQAARRELGNETLIKEVTREMWGGRAWERLLQDCRYGLRTMRRSLGFSAAAVATLALGIGASAAVFGVVDAVLLRALPFQDPERLVRVWEGREKNSRNVVNGWNVLDWRERSKTLQQIAAMQTTPLNVTGQGAPFSAPSIRVSPEFFDILGVPPLLGRGFLAREGVPGQDGVVVLSYGTWQSRFGGDPGVVGRRLTIDGQASEIVGVMPRGFAFPKTPAEMWKPITITRDEGWGRGRSMTTVARLAPGATLEQAQQELKTIAGQLAVERPGFNKGWTADVFRLKEDVTLEVRRPLLVLLAGVGFLLLIACANVANLLLMRGAARQREIAVRVALGAGRFRILQQLLAESLVLALLAAGVGVLAAQAGLRGLIAVLPSSVQLPRAETIAIDGRVLGFAALLAVLTAVLSGLAPALHSARKDLQAALRTGSLRTGVGAGQRLRASFVATQVALALILLVGAGLVLRSFQKLIAVDPGFRTERLLSMNLWMAAAPGVRDANKRADYLERMLLEVRQSPGVDAVSSVHWLPLTGSTSGSCFARGETLPKISSEMPDSEMLVVSPGYFDVVGTPLVAGRDFGPGDVRASRSVIVVNRAFVERFFPREDPLGARLSLCWSLQNPAEIVGVVANARQTQLKKPPQPTIFIANAQSPMYFANLVVRSRGELGPLARAVQAAVERVNPEQALSNMRPMSEVWSSSVAQPRFQLVMLCAFAGIALVLSAIGLYAVVTYSVAERIPEIGIRMALGAGRGDVARLVLREGLVLVGAGVTLGLLASLALTRLLQSILFEVEPTDPATLLGVCVLLLLVAVVSTLLPARRAMAVEPMGALRSE